MFVSKMQTGLKMNKVAVSENILSWAINRSGVPFAVLEQRLPNIGKWITGEDLPTIQQLGELAKATRTPFGYFFLSEPPNEQLPIPLFRTMTNDFMLRPSPNLLETVQSMKRRQAWMREYLLEQGEEPLRFVRSANIDDDYSQVANRIRSTLGLKEGWAAEQKTWEDALKVLRNAMENKGILIVVNGIVGNDNHRKLDPTEFRGFVLVDEYAPLVFVNGTDGIAAQMFTQAHELAHLWFGSSAAFDLREMLPAKDPMEQACDKVAAEFLIPKYDLIQIWPSFSQDPEPFQKIARHFKVSVLVAARRALDLRLIMLTDFLDFYNAYQKDERRKKDKKTDKPKKGDFYTNQNFRVGKRFANTVIRAVKEGRLLYREAYHLTGLRGSTFEEYTNKLGLGRRL
jgi:Zn-dependent peptidase ImmA (M78 family)